MEDKLENDDSTQSDDVALPENAHKSALIEALLFASGEALGISALKDVSGLPEKEIGELLESVAMKFELEDSGIELVNVAGKYQLRTKKEFSEHLRALRSGRPRRLSGQALETLAIVAYRQPIVKSDVERIRGVDATPTLKTLLDRRLIKIVGHRASVGRPALYGTTDEFLKVFGLHALSELPTLRDLKEFDCDPGEVEESEAVEDSKELQEETADSEGGQEDQDSPMLAAG